MAQDQDGDGVSDGSDRFPCDPATAGEAFGPAEAQYGTLLFEDEWPFASDQDLNDLVLDYNYRVVTDAQGRAVSLTATYHVAALGGQTPIGLGLRLPFSPSAVGVSTITDRTGTRNLPANPYESGATYELAADLSVLFAGATQPFNVVTGQSAVSGETIVVQLSFSTPILLAMSAAPFDAYIFRSLSRSHETHLPAYSGTYRANSAHYGTGDDGSAPGRYYVDTNGVPFVLNLPQSTNYPSEFTHVAQLWPSITSFAASGGTTNQNFYASSQNATWYASRVSAPALSASTPDVSCVPSGYYPDPAGFNTLWHVSTLGDDITGNGSDVNPFASVHVAIAAAASGDGIQIHPGVYRLVPQVHYSGYMTAGIYDQSKRLSIFGFNSQTILEVHSSDVGLRDSHVFSLKGQQTINGVTYGSVFSNFVVHFYPNRNRSYSDAIVGWNKLGAEIRNVVIENKSTTTNYTYIYDNGNPAETPRFINTVFISNGRWAGRYTGRPSYINCIMENAPNAFTTLSSNVTRRATAADLGGSAIPADLLNQGDPGISNPDGSRSHIGVRGGVYAWP